MIVLAAAALQGAAPLPLRTFSDWVVGCDNLRTCRAAVSTRDAVPLTVRRGGEAAASASITVPLPGAARGARVTLRIDGEAVATIVSPGGGGGLALPLDGALLERLAQGRAITLTDAAGRRIGAASLAGLSDALRHIDEVQGRGGTVTALRLRGGRAAATIPDVPSLPTVVQPEVTGRPPRSLSAKDAARLAGCDRPASRTTAPTWRLDAAHSLAIVASACGDGRSAAFVVDEKGRTTPARFDPDEGGAPRAVAWNAPVRRLTSGTGACATHRSFAWDGTMFRLAEQREPLACRGTDDEVVTWRVRVVPG